MPFNRNTSVWGGQQSMLDPSMNAISPNMPCDMNSLLLHRAQNAGSPHTVLTTMSDVRDRCRKLTWNLPMLLSWST